VTRAGYAGSDGWYKLRFTAPRALPGRSCALRFDEARRSATVWLNESRLGSSVDNFAPFRLPATGIRPGHTNLPVVRVDSRRVTGSFPQDWWNWAGLTQPVELVPVGRIAVRDLGVMPQLGCDDRCGDLLVQGTARNLAPVALAPRFVVNLRSPDGSTRS
jgi:hypothetical protein